MKRSLLAIALGIAFLILMIWIGTMLDSIVPHGVTAKVQTAQAGPYHVTFQVNPNPPLTTQATTLSVQVLLNASQQPVANAHVTLMSNMQTMDMGIDEVEAQVIISLPGAKQTARATFEVAAQ